MAVEPDPEKLMTALTTEHFTLQGARTQTMQESSSRASIFIFSVSSALVALGFIGQTAGVDDVFEVFALTILPTLYVLGLITAIRLVECGAEDYRYGVAINRIRGYYKEVAGERANLFLLSGHDDGEGVFMNMSVPAEGRTQYYTFATVVSVVAGVVGGSAVAIALGAFVDASLAAAAIGGAAAACTSVAALARHASTLLESRTAGIDSLYPTQRGATPSA